MLKLRGDVWGNVVWGYRPLNGKSTLPRLWKKRRGRGGEEKEQEEMEEVEEEEEMEEEKRTQYVGNQRTGLGPDPAGV